MEYISATNFRANIYNFLDLIGKTGKPQLIMLKGELYELRKKSKRTAEKKHDGKKNRDLSKIKPISCMTEPPEWYISPKLHEWSGEIDSNVR
ncbi:MAG: hypothetical protein SFX19_01730 [Alphaproteobacteria bacterium]|nr:hypothetical protein [Alphaproteobacteria bacterium]